MKWPVKPLDARLKASLRKLFLNGRAERKRENHQRIIPTTWVSHEEERLENTWRGEKSMSTEPITFDPTSNAAEKHLVKQFGREGSFGSNKLYSAPPMENAKTFAHASINTDQNEAYGHRDAYIQANLDEHLITSKAPTADITFQTAKAEMNFENLALLNFSKENVESYNFDNEHLFTAQNPSEFPPDQFSSVMLTQHCSDPLLFETDRQLNSSLEPVKDRYVNAGDACIRQVNSSIAGTEDLNYPARWSCETHISHYHSQRPSHSISQEECLEAQQCTWYEYPHSSLPRAFWHFANNPCQQNCIECYPEDMESSRTDNRRVVSEVCIPSVASDEHRGLRCSQSTKEFGDEDYVHIIKENERHHFPRPSSNDVVGGLNGYSKKCAFKGNQPLFSGLHSTTRNRVLSRSHGQQTIAYATGAGSVYAVDTLADRGSSSLKVSRKVDVQSRTTQTVKNYTQCASRPNASHRQVGCQYINSKATTNKQMIHHNCTMAENQRSERSVSSTRKSFPHSTSDDGDATKVTRYGKPTDQSYTSSASGKITQVTETYTRPSTKKQNSVSPPQSKRGGKSGGALPASRDLNQCPTGRHLDVKSDKPCICIMVKKMVIEQSKPVLYSWHIQKKQTNRTIRGVAITNEESEGGKLNSLDVPSLTSFQLARPTRMVRGGQGTVAWVTNSKTCQFYALKFKQREGRSDSTWAIERREAELLRRSSHEFIVKLFHIYETEETIFMALEWLDGGCLWNHIARVGTVPECYAVYYTACILTALRYLHEHYVVYRDMKAENIVLDQRGRPKLIDFGMAKRFGSTKNLKHSTESTLEESCADSDDFDQPPTRYYFAAYLAPEIYDQTTDTDPLIDSWGLGYILVEMLLGYGIFLPMPWEKQAGQHLADDWKLTLPADATNQLSPVCTDFVRKMLLRAPKERLALDAAMKHSLFLRVPWVKLTNMRGPDLTKCSPKSATQSRPNMNIPGQRRWLGKPDNLAHFSDMAFVKEFYGSVVNSTMNYTTQMLGPLYGRRKYSKPSGGRQTTSSMDGKLYTLEAERTRSNLGGATRVQVPAALEHAMQIRGTQPTSSQKIDGSNTVRMHRREGLSAS